MFIRELLPFVENYLNELDKALRVYAPGKALSRTQRYWLGFCIMGILLTNSVNWTGFARTSLGQYKANALCWMFRHSKSKRLINRIYSIRARRDMLNPNSTTEVQHDQNVRQKEFIGKAQFLGGSYTGLEEKRPKAERVLPPV